MDILAISRNVVKLLSGYQQSSVIVVAVHHWGTWWKGDIKR